MGTALATSTGAHDSENPEGIDMLTKKQHQLLTFIDEHISEKGISPSFDEMKEALNLKSKSGIHRLISALEERGFLRRLRHRARALEVLKRPEEMARENAMPFRRVIEGGRRQEPSRFTSTAPVGVREIPKLSKIAAGQPIDAALGQPDDIVAIPDIMVPASGEYYALTVDGDSMIGAGIHDGDTVIVERSETAKPGEIVVALIHDENKATLKTLKMEGDTIVLQPENPVYEKQRYAPDQVTIQGRLTALMRNYRN